MEKILAFLNGRTESNLSGIDPELFWCNGSGYIKYIEGLGKIEVIESVGGEGEGDHIHTVICVNDEYYFRNDGRWESYEGSDWPGKWYHVNKIEKTIFVYE